MGKAEEHEAKELSLYQLEIEKQKNEELAAIELLEKKHRINNQWCDYMTIIFEKYRDELEETKINVPEATCRILKKNGVQIDGLSQDDIYKGFNLIIQEQKHIEDYLKKQRDKYSGNMPW